VGIGYSHTSDPSVTRLRFSAVEKNERRTAAVASVDRSSSSRLAVSSGKGFRIGNSGFSSDLLRMDM